jgi:hypothetical protein
MSRPPAARPAPGALAALAVIALGGGGCGPGFELRLFFADELVEAPTRSVDLTALGSGSCERALARAHDRPADDELALVTANAPYPLTPDAEALDRLPDDRSFALDVTAYDRGRLRVGRGCAIVDPRHDAEIAIELRSLPRCASPPTHLDVMIVLDTSRTMGLADPEGAHIDALLDFVLVEQALPADTTWGLVTHGHDGEVRERVPETRDLAALRATIEGLRNRQSGQARLYDGIAQGAALLRARSRCGRRPALLVLAAEADEASERLYQEAAIAIYAGQGDAEDDVYTYAVGFGARAYDVLGRLVPIEIGVVRGEQTTLGIRDSLREAQETLVRLVR